MITEVNIKNFKSIVDLTLPLSNINVFIGANGCGKSNILEANGFAAEADNAPMMTVGYKEASYEVGLQGILKRSNLYTRGIRDAKPSLIYNAFPDIEKNTEISIKYSFDDVKESWHECLFSIDNVKDPYPEWIVINRRKNIKKNYAPLIDYHIYTPNILALRGLTSESRVEPLGIYGEGLDILISSFSSKGLEEIKTKLSVIEWLDDIILDVKDELKLKGFKAGRGKSLLYFKDKFLSEQNNIFSAENANGGILIVLFYLSLFISNRTPGFFAIDNIENGLNPMLCRKMLKVLSEIAIGNGKQALITTHNPAVLDGLNLNDDRQRLFVVRRNDEGHTQVERIKLKPQTNGEQLKLSEMWMRGYLGGLPTNF